MSTKYPNMNTNPNHQPIQPDFKLVNWTMNLDRIKGRNAIRKQRCDAIAHICKVCVYSISVNIPFTAVCSQ